MDIETLALQLILMVLVLRVGEKSLCHEDPTESRGHPLPLDAVGYFTGMW